MNRRSFVKSAAVTAFSLTASCQTDSAIEIIDTHTHFYDPTRPEGVPWPKKGTRFYKKVMPEDFEKLTKPLGVTGTVVVEASAWLEDNQWILDLARDNKSIVGFVGNVDPSIDDWEKHIKRFAKDDIFKGIRLKQSMGKLDDPEIIKSLKLMNDLDLCIDLNGGAKALEAAAKISKSIPDMRIVVEHLPGRRGLQQPPAYLEGLKSVQQLQNVYVKISSLLSKVNDKPITDPNYYVKHLDLLWNTFGEDRVIYGSNWPVSDFFHGEYKDVLNVVDSYFTAKGSVAREKYFAINAHKAYKWVKR